LIYIFQPNAKVEKVKKEGSPPEQLRPICARQKKGRGGRGPDRILLEQGKKGRSKAWPDFLHHVHGSKGRGKGGKERVSLTKYDLGKRGGNQPIGGKISTQLSRNKDEGRVGPADR